MHSIATDSKGNVFTTETYRGQRVQKFIYKGLVAVTKKGSGRRLAGVEVGFSGAEFWFLTSQHFRILKFFQRARPVRSEQSREPPVCKQSSSGLANGTIVRFVVGIPDTLHRSATTRAGQSVTAVHCHFLSRKAVTFSGKALLGFVAKASNPGLKRDLGSSVKPCPFFVFELLRLRQRGKLRLMQDLV